MRAQGGGWGQRSAQGNSYGGWYGWRGWGWGVTALRISSRKRKGINGAIKAYSLGSIVGGRFG